MKLLIDIGNTNCSIAIADGKTLRKRYFIHTSRETVQAGSIRRLLGKLVQGIEEIIIVSVVPEFLSIMTKSLGEVCCGVPVRIVGEDIKVPMRIKYRSPEEIGQDRLVTAYAASREYGDPVLVIDFGTAVTFDYVSIDGSYEGGIIFPGLRVSLASLVEMTALLPDVAPHKVKGLIGKDTRGSMNKGIVLGYASLCDGIIERFRSEYGDIFDVVCTGGDAPLIAEYTKSIDHISRDLVWLGLRYLSAISS